jgi:hypothetical protein
MREPISPAVQSESLLRIITIGAIMDMVLMITVFVQHSEMFNTCGVLTSFRKRTPQGFNIYSRRKAFPTRGTPPRVQQIMARSMSYEPLD